MTFPTWIKDVLEKAFFTFVQFGLTLIVAGKALDMSFAHEMATAGIAAVWVVVLNAIPALTLPAVPPWLDVAGRAGKSFLQAAVSLLVAAGSGWLDITIWQGALVAGVVAAAAVLKGAIAVHVKPDAISPASVVRPADSAPVIPVDA